MTYKLVLLRHGQSEWNEKNLFTGWVDVNLTDKGRAEAQRGGELLKERHILPDVVHTSLQRRAINTANISLDAADRLWINLFSVIRSTGFEANLMRSAQPFPAQYHSQYGPLLSHPGHPAQKLCGDSTSTRQ